MAYSKAGTDKSTASGSGNAVSLELQGFGSPKFDLHYEVNADGTIHVEIDVSDPSDDATTTWKTFDQIDTSQSDTDRQDVYQDETMFHAVRAYADGTDFGDADVVDLTIAARLTV